MAKSKADNYMGSGMSKGAYLKSKGGTEKKSASSGFNYSSLGISQSTWDSLGSKGQSAVSVIGSGIVKIMDKNQPLPEVLDKKEMNKLWKEAEADTVIQKTFGEEMNVAKDYLNKNIDLVSAEFKSLTEDQQRQYIDAKKQLNEAQAAAGTAYSGFRGQAKQSLETKQTDIVGSSQREIQKQLDQLGQTFEQRFGSSALAGTKLSTAIGAGDIGTYGGEKYAGAGYGTELYNPTGGIGGTQATDILAAKTTKQSDLAAEELQSIQLQNIQKEKKQAEAIDKLKNTISQYT